MSTLSSCPFLLIFQLIIGAEEVIIARTGEQKYDGKQERGIVRSFLIACLFSPKGYYW